MEPTQSEIIGGGSLEGGTIKGKTQVDIAGQNKITPEVLQAIKEDYLKFIDNENDKDLEYAKRYELIHENSAIIKLFYSVPFPEGEKSLIKDLEGKYMKKPNKRFLFSYAKVLNSNIEGIQTGDIVTLRDSDVATLLNPHYELFTSADEMNKSNAVIQGGTPKKYVNNIQNKAGKIFYPRKLDVRSHFEDKYTFCVGKPELVTKIVDPKLMVDELSKYEA